MGEGGEKVGIFLACMNLAQNGAVHCGARSSCGSCPNLQASYEGEFMALKLLRSHAACIQAYEVGAVVFVACRYEV